MLEVMPQHFQRLSLLAQLAIKRVDNLVDLVVGSDNLTLNFSDSRSLWCLKVSPARRAFA